MNTFAFTGDEAGMAAPHVLLSPPEVQPGRVVLRVDVPRVVGENRRFGSSTRSTKPAPRARPGATWPWPPRPSPCAGKGRRPIQLRQDRGRMEFARKRMREVETFRIEISTE